MGERTNLRDEKELFTDADADSVQKPESPKTGANVYKFADEWARRRFSTYNNAKTVGEYLSGERKIPTMAEVADSIYKSRIENPVKRKIRDIFAKRGKYVEKAFDEYVVKNSIDNYVNGKIDIPMIPSDDIEYEGKKVLGKQDGSKIKYLRAHKIKKMLGKHTENIKNELGMSDRELETNLENMVGVHEYVELNYMKYLGMPKLDEERHGWLQATITNYLRLSENPEAKKLGEVAYRVDSLRNDEFGQMIKKYRLAT